MTNTPVERAPLTDEQAQLIEQRLAEARNAVRDFAGNTTLAHHCTRNGSPANRASWPTILAVANNKLVPTASLATQVRHTSIVMRQIIEMIAPNRISGRINRQITNEHHELEMKKAMAVGRIATAGFNLLDAYPIPERDLHNTNTKQFMELHAGAIDRWLRETAVAAREVRTRPRVQKVPLAQQSLI